jgi:Asp-tRNA(Asn)/Glu-tRNA(Gln) amidotransferase A subunit family amidase
MVYSGNATLRDCRIAGQNNKYLQNVPALKALLEPEGMPGTFSAYDKSLKVRRAVRNSLNELFGKYDLILAPVSSETEYKDADMGTVYNESYFTSLGMMMGLPTVAVGGVQLMGNSFCEKKLFAAAEQLTEVE